MHPMHGCGKVELVDIHWAVRFTGDYIIESPRGWILSPMCCCLTIKKDTCKFNY